MQNKKTKTGKTKLHTENNAVCIITIITDCRLFKWSERSEHYGFHIFRSWIIFRI